MIKMYKSKWENLTTKQKRHRIFRTTAFKAIFFWGVCGKDRQQYYQHIDINDENVDEIRNKMFEEYMNALENGNFRNADKKIKLIKNELGKD